jgi:hypothetical protein
MRRTAGQLRRIAVYVDETEGGPYQWVLLEQDRKSARWNEIQVAGRSWTTYHEAMSAGLLALQAMIDDLSAGPRGDPTPPPKTKPRQEPEAQTEPEPEPAPKRTGSHFGFGDLRS